VQALIGVSVEEGPFKDGELAVECVEGSKLQPMRREKTARGVLFV